MIRIRFLCLLPVLFALPASSLRAQEVSPAEKLMSASRPLVIAHRGYSEIAPENTLPSFRLANAAAADMVELDYYHSRDGALVVFHDRTLDRTTNAVEQWGGAEIPVDSKTLAELKTLDAGKWFDPQFTGTRIPTLVEALDCIQSGGITLIERKAGDAAACVNLLRERGGVNSVIIQAFDWKYLAEFHTLEPRQILGALGPPSVRDGRKLTDAEKTLSPQFIEEAQSAGARIVGWNSNITSAAVEYAHQKGMKVWIYTINKPDDAGRMLAMKVDGIITNNVSLIWRTMTLRQPSAAK